MICKDSQMESKAISFTEHLVISRVFIIYSWLSLQIQVHITRNGRTLALIILLEFLSDTKL